MAGTDFPTCLTQADEADSGNRSSVYLSDGTIRLSLEDRPAHRQHGFLDSGVGHFGEGKVQSV